MGGNNIQFYFAVLVGHAMLLPGTVSKYSYSPLRKYGVSDHLEMKYLGDSDGKSYYVNYSESMDWANAKVYCLSSNLRMATIESTDQKEFLKTALRSGSGRSSYWTSARESRLPSMMVWDDSNVQPNPCVHQDYRHGEASNPYYYCGGFTVDGDINTRMYTIPCSFHRYALCEADYY